MVLIACFIIGVVVHGKKCGLVLATVYYVPLIQFIFRETLSY